MRIALLTAVLALPSLAQAGAQDELDGAASGKAETVFDGSSGLRDSVAAPAGGATRRKLVREVKEPGSVRCDYPPPGETFPGGVESRCVTDPPRRVRVYRLERTADKPEPLSPGTGGALIGGAVGLAAGAAAAAGFWGLIGPWGLLVGAAILAAGAVGGYFIGKKIGKRA